MERGAKKKKKKKKKKGASASAGVSVSMSRRVSTSSAEILALTPSLEEDSDAMGDAVPQARNYSFASKDAHAPFPSSNCS